MNLTGCADDVCEILGLPTRAGRREPFQPLAREQLCAHTQAFRYPLSHKMHSPALSHIRRFLDVNPRALFTDLPAAVP